MIIFDDELVLLAEDGGNFGSIAYKIFRKYLANNYAHVLKDSPKIIITDFLCYSLMFYDITKIVNGTTRIKLTQSPIRKKEFYLLSLEVQNKITSLLDKL